MCGGGRRPLNEPDCPSTYTFDTGDYAEPESCGLPVEHNADDEPWHVSEWEHDGERARLEWRWDKETLVTRWPPPKDALPSALIRRLYEGLLVTRALNENVLFKNVPTGEIPESHGVTVQWRKWGDLPTATALKAQETASTGDAAARDPA
jgi:hypothetical protein